MKKILLEALDEYQKKYVDEHLGGDEYDRYRTHVNLFDSYEKTHPNRIFLDIPNNLERTSDIDVIRHLDKHGYQLEDYKKGLARKTFTDTNGNQKKQLISIGKVLHRTGASEILTNKKNIHGKLKSVMDVYNESRDGVNKDLKLVISRDKHDIAGMSTDRHWESCMTLPSEYDRGGCNHSMIKSDLLHHTLAAYLINKGDDDIENPLGRVLIKKHISEDGKEIYRVSRKSYGNLPSEYYDLIDSYMKKHYPSENGISYLLHPDLYHDSNPNITERVGIHSLNGVVNHYNDLGLLHDYVDEKGNHQPASNGNGVITHYNNGNLHREGDKPASVMYKDGKIVSAKWVKNGYAHREDDKPAEIKYDTDGNVTEQTSYRYGIEHSSGNTPSHIEYHGSVASKRYKKYGLLHSPDNDTPSNQQINENGNISRLEYHRENIYHREGDLPAIISYYSNGNVDYTHCYKNGILHTDSDIPAKVKYFPNGKLFHQGYYKNGKLNREGDKPASIQYNSDGTIYAQEYYKNNLLHREGGKPAAIMNGDNKKTIGYYINGEKHSPDENTPSYEEIFTNGDYTRQYHQHGIPFRKDGLPNHSYRRTYGNEIKEVHEYNLNGEGSIVNTRHVKNPIKEVHTTTYNVKDSVEHPLIKTITKYSNGDEQHEMEYDHSKSDTPYKMVTDYSGGKVTRTYEKFHSNYYTRHTVPSNVEKFYDNGNLIHTIANYSHYDYNVPKSIETDKDGNVTKYYDGNYNKETTDKNGNILSYGINNLEYSKKGDKYIISNANTLHGSHFYMDGENVIYDDEKRGKFILKGGKFYDLNGNEIDNKDDLYSNLNNIGRDLNTKFKYKEHENLYKRIENEL